MLAIFLPLCEIAHPDKLNFLASNRHTVPEYSVPFSWAMAVIIARYTDLFSLEANYGIH